MSYRYNFCTWNRTCELAYSPFRHFIQNFAADLDSLWILLTYLLTPWSRVLFEKLIGFAASQEILRILWNPKVHYRIHKCTPPVPISRGSISPCEYFLTMLYHGEALLAPRPTPKQDDHSSSAVRDCLFNIFAATLHIGGRSSIHNLRTCHAVVTGTHLSRHQEVCNCQIKRISFECWQWLLCSLNL